MEKKRTALCPSLGYPLIPVSFIIIPNDCLCCCPTMIEAKVKAASSDLNNMMTVSDHRCPVPCLI